MTDIGRSAGIVGFADILAQAGHDPIRFAREAGVPVKALTDPDMRVRTSAMRRMVETAAEVTGIDDLGLRMVEGRKLSNWGALGLAVRDQPTMRDAIAVMEKYLWLQTESYTVHLEEKDDLAILHLQSVTWLGARQSPELAVAVFFVNFKHVMGENWRPLELRFQHPRPKRIDTHQRIFGMTPLFDQAIQCIILKRSDLDLAPVTADPVMAKQALAHLEHLAASRASDFRSRVEREIALALPRGDCTVEILAHKLHMDRRTLHRRLAASETSFTALVDTIRAEVAAGMLADTRHPVQKIAEDLGFASLSSFAHWFKRHFGQSASEFRTLAMLDAAA